MRDLKPLKRDIVEQTEPTPEIMIRGNQIYRAPYTALTPSDGTLANAVIRQSEIETALKALGLLK